MIILKFINILMRQKGKSLLIINVQLNLHGCIQNHNDSIYEVK